MEKGKKAAQDSRKKQKMGGEYPARKLSVERAKRPIGSPEQEGEAKIWNKGPIRRPPVERGKRKLSELRNDEWKRAKRPTSHGRN